MDSDRNLHAVADHQNEELPAEPPSRWRLRGRSVWFVLLLVVLPVLTYVATVNDFLDWLTGPQYSQTELDAAIAAAEKSGFSQGEGVGYEDGYEEGLDAGKSAGEEAGFQRGLEAGERIGFGDGYSIGSSEGYDEGYTNGSVDSYSIGFQDGCLLLFDLLGTSRIGSWWDYYYIPSYAYYYESGVCY